MTPAGISLAIGLVSLVIATLPWGLLLVPVIGYVVWTCVPKK